MNTLIQKWLLLILFAATYTISGCESAGTNATGDQASLSVSFATNNTAMQKSSTLQSNHLQITSAKLLVREIEFESDLEDDNVPEDSLDFETGPLVINLNLDGSVTTVAVNDVEPGTYDEIEFDVHKPEDNETPPDPDFKIGTSGDERFSVIVEGIYDVQEFLYRSNENMEQEHELAEPLVLEEGSDINVTLSVDLSTWFVDELGNNLDPTIEDNRDAIDESIKRSFEAFEDDDEDGNDDDDSGSEDDV